MERLPIYIELSERVVGWTRGEEAEALIHAEYHLPDGAVIVEIGSFLGSGSILLAGARKLRRSGKVHCVDPFDASGDSFSVPVYEGILAGDSRTNQLQMFEDNMRRAGVSRWVAVHPGQAQEIARAWTTPADMIFMDGDQSPKGARATFEAWESWLKQGGTLAIHNSNEREYAPEHNGQFLVRQRLEARSDYSLADEVGSTSFFRKNG